MNILNELLSIFTLTVLEIVLGIDNLIFLSILTERLAIARRKQARFWGLTFAWVTRLLLLASAVWLAKLTHPVITLVEISFSIRDFFMLFGGMFLIAKSTQEIHSEMNDFHTETNVKNTKQVTFSRAVIQIGLMDVIFSLDSVLTAIGLTTNYWIMTIAITIAILVMLYASEPVAKFIEKYPTFKMLALSFLILVGMLLIADGFGLYVPRGYLYFSITFSLAVEVLNLWRTRRKRRVKHRKMS